ncbi:MAG: prolyl-tRNA synthetase associated domain-containing protein [Pseudomonadota bacterium]
MDAEGRLFARFREMGIAWQSVEHEPTFTVAESRHLAQSLPGSRSKSLLLTDKDGRLTLVTALGSVKVDIKKVGQAISARGRLSFASPEVMQSVLGVAPGHLTPLALINNQARRLGNVVLDAALMEHDPVWAHPLRNTASTGIAGADLQRFCELHARQVSILPLAQPAPSSHVR